MRYFRSESVKLLFPGNAYIEIFFYVSFISKRRGPDRNLLKIKFLRKRWKPPQNLYYWFIDLIIIFSFHSALQIGEKSYIYIRCLRTIYTKKWANMVIKVKKIKGVPDPIIFCAIDMKLTSLRLNAVIENLFTLFNFLHLACNRKCIDSKLALLLNILHLHVWHKH